MTADAHFCAFAANIAIVQANSEMFRAGERVVAAVSGGADSVALLRWLAALAPERGFTLAVAHFQHHLRGMESDADEAFVRGLAAKLGVPFHRDEADTRMLAAGRSLEDAARDLRYGFFRRLLRDATADVIVTAHTLDDQAETVLMKIIRGAWTEGIAGIAPEINFPGERGRIVRPMLAVRRADVEAYLHSRDQAWRDDASNADEAFTRNRVRHSVVPLLRELNPAVDTALARMADIARAEEEHWASRTKRALAEASLPGRPVRGGGRSVSTSDAVAPLALDLQKLALLDFAERRRVLRAAAQSLGFATGFNDTAAIESLLDGRPGRKLQLASGLRVERTARELRFETGAPPLSAIPAAVECPACATTDAPGFGLRITLGNGPPATLRVWKAGDRVRLRHTLSDSKVKEVLQRLHAPPEEKAAWPVLEQEGRIVWMQGAAVAGPADRAVEVRSLGMD